MANAKKKTQRDFYNELLALAINDEQREFINGRIAQLDKKASSKSSGQTATQKANAELKTKILAEMESGKAYTVTAMLKELECTSTPPITDKSSSNMIVKIYRIHLIFTTP